MAKASVKNLRTMPEDQATGMFYIDPALLDNEQWHYAFCELNVLGQETLSAEQYMRKGYEIVKPEDLKGYSDSTQATLDKLRGREKQEYIMKGGQILMRCPRELYEKRKKKLAKENRNILEKTEFAEKDNFMGARTFIERQDISRTRARFVDDDEE